MANSTPTQQAPPFLPTIPPEIHFPQDDETDYEQNNIHRPMNPLVTGIPGNPFYSNAKVIVNKKLVVFVYRYLPGTGNTSFPEARGS